MYDDWWVGGRMDGWIDGWVGDKDNLKEEEWIGEMQRLKVVIDVRKCKVALSIFTLRWVCVLKVSRRDVGGTVSKAIATKQHRIDVANENENSMHSMTSPHLNSIHSPFCHSPLQLHCRGRIFCNNGIFKQEQHDQGDCALGHFQRSAN